AIFSVVNAVLLDPLSFPEPDELVVIRGSAPGTDMDEEFQLGPEFFLAYSESARSLEGLAYYGWGQTTVRAGTQVDRLFASRVPPELYSTLRIAPLVGRLPNADDEEGTVAVLSHWLWNDWFGRDPGVVGQTLEGSGATMTIVGVLPQSFRFPAERVSVWVHDLITPPAQPGTFTLPLVGRLSPGATIDSLTAELSGLTPRV